MITGLGAVTPLGLSAESSWGAAIAGHSGIAPITQFDASTFPCRIAGEVKGFDSLAANTPMAGMERGARFGVAAAAMALSEAGAGDWRYPPGRIGVAMGCGRPGPDLLAVGHLLNEQPRALADHVGAGPVRGRSFEAGTAAVATMADARGPNYSVYTACSSGTQAIGQAMRCIQRGDADAMIAGGYDSMVNEMCVIGFSLLRVLSTDNGHPQTACRPFDRDRTGLVLGEGAGVLVLEELGHARRRGAPILGEILGYAATLNAYRITDPDPDADGPTRAILAALADGACPPSAIDYVNAHGTATWANDPIETLAFRRVFGGHAPTVAVSSTKSMTGHLMAAAGAVETVFCAQALRDGIIPPTINLEHPDRRCDLDYVPKTAREAPISRALNVSFGFGGVNAALILARFED